MVRARTKAPSAGNCKEQQRGEKLLLVFRPDAQPAGLSPVVEGPRVAPESSIPSDPSVGEWERLRVSAETAAGSLRASSKPLRPCFAAGTPRGEARAREDTGWVVDRCWSPPAPRRSAEGRRSHAPAESGHEAHMLVLRTL